MAKTPKNHGKPWTSADNNQLDKLIRQNTPTRLIAHKLGRTTSSVYAHASEEGKSLKPTNQRPYNRRKKKG
ncbi:MAG: hypothetical protein CMJ94_14230 [Planctomycetes bacterium]|nr:hypothetical protein [Planctomycetota bacterium]|tara:strand:- start:63 stop:275 length:213 start_codon:yes stop_codon:yes gene_type:complete